MSVSISAAIITFNEERNIRRCIESLKWCVDEIVVLDSYSTDKTVEICKELGVVIIQKEWMGYTQSKNYLNSKITSEYIFSIDADEALNEALKSSLNSLRIEGFSGVYSLSRMTNYCGKWIHHSGWFPDEKVRVFPKEGSKWVGEHVHEELEFSEMQQFHKLEGILEHYSYYSFEDHRRRADKYSSLTAIKYVEQGKNAGSMKPFFSGLGRFISMFFLKKGFLDGYMGFKIALISAQSNVFKYKEVRRIYRDGRN
jgi:glycosyltransferase involved in cell wall biosynthesis